MLDVLVVVGLLAVSFLAYRRWSVGRSVVDAARDPAMEAVVRLTEVAMDLTGSATDPRAGERVARLRGYLADAPMDLRPAGEQLIEAVGRLDRAKAELGNPSGATSPADEAEREAAEVAYNGALGAWTEAVKRTWPALRAAPDRP